MASPKLKDKHYLLLNSSLFPFENINCKTSLSSYIDVNLLFWGFF